MMAVFDSYQRGKLSNLGLSTGQIDALDGLMGVMKPALIKAKPQPIGPLKKMLANLQAHLHATANTLEAFCKLHGKPPDMEVAGDAFLAAASLEMVGPEVLDAYAARTRQLERLCTQAIEGFPDQARSRAAHPLPVARIWETIVEHHDRKKLMTLSLSSSPSGQFMAVCRICYAAMTGNPDQDPERAVKAYVGRVRANERQQQEAAAIPTKPKRLGRQITKKGGLPS